MNDVNFLFLLSNILYDYQVNDMMNNLKNIEYSLSNKITTLINQFTYLLINHALKIILTAAEKSNMVENKYNKISLILIQRLTNTIHSELKKCIRSNIYLIDYLNKILNIQSNIISNYITNSKNNKLNIYSSIIENDISSEQTNDNSETNDNKNTVDLSELDDKNKKHESDINISNVKENEQQNILNSDLDFEKIISSIESCSDKIFSITMNQ